MSQTIHPSSPDLNADAQIKREALELAKIYTIDQDAFKSAVGQLDFARYAEYVIGAENFEIIAGGVGQDGIWAETARRLGVSEDIVGRFERCAARFPGKMTSMKLCFGPMADHPTLYLNVVEPWEAVFSFLETLPETKDAIAALRGHLRRSKICMLLAFSMDRRYERPVVKTYHAHDRADRAEYMPLVASYRLECGEVRAQPKYYNPIQWQDIENIDKKLTPIAAEVADILGRPYQALHGYHLTRGEVQDSKVYIFRRDVRAMWRSRHDSIYTSEGNVLLGLRRFDDAIHAYTNAIDYDARDYVAYISRGLCRALIGDYAAALDDTKTARALEPNMNFRLASESCDTVVQIVDLSRRIDMAPTAPLHNQRGVILFSRGLFAEAKRDFEAAVRFDPNFAEAYNNLGAAHINLGCYAEAFDCCGKAISLDDSTDTTNYLLALNGLRDNQRASDTRAKT